MLVIKYTSAIEIGIPKRKPINSFNLICKSNYSVCYFHTCRQLNCYVYKVIFNVEYFDVISML